MNSPNSGVVFNYLQPEIFDYFKNRCIQKNRKSDCLSVLDNKKTQATNHIMNTLKIYKLHCNPTKTQNLKQL